LFKAAVNSDIITLAVVYKCLLTDCVDEQQQFIESAATAGHQRDTINVRLLDILRRRSVADFKNFTNCLINTGQRHLATLLDTGGGWA